MHLEDIFGDGEHSAHIRQRLAAEKKARKLKDRGVPGHPSAQKVISEFEKRVSKSSSGAPETLSAITLVIPPPYRACTLPLDKLEPVAISRLRLEMHHRGKVVLLRTLTSPLRTASLHTIVEDENGTAIEVVLYYQPSESVMAAEKILPRGAIYALKEPFLRYIGGRFYLLRVDHPGDLVRLADTDERVPQKWRKEAQHTSADSNTIRLEGNAAVERQNWTEAERLYTSAIQAAKTPEEEQMAYLNRSLANLKLDQPEAALSDAIKGSGDAESPSEKGLFREARALYEMGNFARCLEKLEALAASYPENEAVKPEIARVKARQHEQQTGQYSFRQMYNKLAQNPDASPIFDCATFSVPLEVRPSYGLGSGLFTTVPISAGQLIICEKAIGYIYGADTKEPKRSNKVLINMGTKKILNGSQIDLIAQLVQKLHNNRQLSRTFHEVYGSERPIASAVDSDGNLVIDSFLVDKLVGFRSLHCPRITGDLSSKETLVGIDEGGDKTRNYNCCGLWPLASHIKHCCIANCRRSFIGDMQIIRAATDLAAGEELAVSYYSPIPWGTYKDIREIMRTWGLVCCCELCAQRKAMSQPVLEKRNTLRESIQAATRDSSKMDIPDVLRLIKKLNKTYSATPTTTIRLELFTPFFAVGIKHITSDNPAEGIEMIVKALEVLGFRIAAHPPGPAKVSRLEVKKWGIPHFAIPFAFAGLFRAYRVLAPELCPAAKKYVEISYSMIVGHVEPILEVFPELAE